MSFAIVDKDFLGDNPTESTFTELELIDIINELHEDSKGYVKSMKKSPLQFLQMVTTFYYDNGKWYLPATTAQYVRTNKINLLSDEILYEGVWKQNTETVQVYLQFSTPRDIGRYIDNYIKITRYYRRTDVYEVDRVHRQGAFNEITETADLIRLFASDDKTKQNTILTQFVAGRQLSDGEMHMEYVESGEWTYDLLNLRTTVHNMGFINFEGTYTTGTTPESKIQTPYEFKGQVTQLEIGDHLFDETMAFMNEPLSTPNLLSGVAMYKNMEDIHIPEGTLYEYLVSGKDMFRSAKFNEQDLINLEAALTSVNGVQKGVPTRILINSITTENLEVFHIGDQQFIPLHSVLVIPDKTITVGLEEGYIPSPELMAKFTKKGWTLEVA